MLTEEFVAATLAANKPNAHLSSALKDVGIYLHQFQPRHELLQGFKKSSVQPSCLAVGESLIFASQADKAVINVYSRDSGHQLATVPFPARIRSLVYAEKAAILVLGTEDGKLILWEIATGRLSTSAASHIQAITSLCLTANNELIVSGSADALVHVWSLPTLVSFADDNDSFSSRTPTNSPLRTFQNHRSAISALACGHSRYSTNFAVSASIDKTTYIWDIVTCQVLQTVLLPSTPLCLGLDPADRAIYTGTEEGEVYCIDLFSRDNLKPLRVAGIHAKNITPTQLTLEQGWSHPASHTSAASCLAVSYDGTAIITGHSSGDIVRWDVAKRSFSTVLANMNQPVTNLIFLQPIGLQQSRNAVVVTNVVKPRLELSNGTGQSGIVPEEYSLQAQIRNSPCSNAEDDFSAAVHGHTLPVRLVEKAIRSVEMLPFKQSSNGTSASNLVETEQLSDEVKKLKKQIQDMHDIEEQRRLRKMARMESREQIGLAKRQAYFAAKKGGKDGDAAMKEYEEREEAINLESDDEYLGDGMDVT